VAFIRNSFIEIRKVFIKNRNLLIIIVYLSFSRRSAEAKIWLRINLLSD
jgi:hypothetical protein